MEKATVSAFGAITSRRTSTAVQQITAVGAGENADFEVPRGERWLIRSWAAHSNRAGGGLMDECWAAIVRNTPQFGALTEFIIDDIWAPGYVDAIPAAFHNDTVGRVLPQPIILESRDILRIVVNHSLANDVITYYLSFEILQARDTP